MQNKIIKFGANQYVFRVHGIFYLVVNFNISAQTDFIDFTVI